MTGQWSVEDKKRLVCVVAPLIEMQKAYGKTLDMKLVLRGWQTLLEDKYTIDQIIYALSEYALQRDDFPSPANINSILNPEKPKITESQFIAAQKAQERNGYPRFSPEAYIIKEYESQNYEQKEIFRIENKKIAEIANNSIKLIDNEQQELI